MKHLWTSPTARRPPSGWRPPGGRAPWVLAAGAILILGSVLIAWLSSAAAPSSAAMPTNPAIEAKWGVRVTQVGVTADGGMVDFRFIVLDPDKALAMMQDVNKLPVLTAEDSGTLVNSTAAMTAKHDLNAGQTYFLLYRNTRGAIKPGTHVTVRFGDLRIEHVVAK